MSGPVRSGEVDVRMRSDTCTRPNRTPTPSSEPRAWVTAASTPDSPTGAGVSMVCTPTRSPDPSRMAVGFQNAPGALFSSAGGWATVVLATSQSPAASGACPAAGREAARRAKTMPNRFTIGRLPVTQVYVKPKLAAPLLSHYVQRDQGRWGTLRGAVERSSDSRTD